MANELTLCYTFTQPMTRSTAELTLSQLGRLFFNQSVTLQVMDEFL